MISSVSKYLWNKDSSESQTLASDERMIALGDTLQGVLKNSSIKIPKIVAAGTQSSGKSTVINRLVGMKILPTGNDIVSRAPLHLEVIHSHNKSVESRAEFGEYRDGIWEITSSIELIFPTPTPEQQQQVRSQIEHETIKKAGPEKNISAEVIHLRIISPYVTNLSLIDLPGLTAVACTDRGQPVDIKQKLTSLIGKFISDSSVLILAIMAGRSDLEADSGLELVKKFDPNGQRTVGVLTKIDLMNDPADISKYLENKVSRDLQLKNGYFALRNPSLKDTDISMIEAQEAERDYFSGNPALNKKTISRHIGISSLKTYLAHLLTNAMKMSLPSIQTGLNRELTEVNQKLEKFGDNLPDSDEGKSSYMHSLLVDYAKRYGTALKERGNTGRIIRDILVEFRKQLQTVNVFNSQSEISDKQLQEIVLNSEGNHMSFPYPPVEILERCLQDPKIKPINQFLTVIQNCNNQVTDQLVNLVDQLIDNCPISKFPELRCLVKQHSLQDVIVPMSTLSSSRLDEIVDAQEGYIWTDNAIFHEMLAAFGKQECRLPALRKLLAQYVTSISEPVADIVPKLIMYYLVDNSVKNLYTTLYSKIGTQNASKLLVEDSDVERERRNLLNLRSEIETALKTVEHL